MFDVALEIPIFRVSFYLIMLFFGPWLFKIFFVFLLLLDLYVWYWNWLDKRQKESEDKKYKKMLKEVYNHED